MTAVHMISNTEKVYPCINCGSETANIVREGKSLADTKLKCSSCGFMYTAEDSKKLETKGEIPDGAPVIQQKEPIHEDRKPAVRVDRQSKPNTSTESKADLPRSPAYIFIAKDRGRSEICSKRDFKTTLLSWEYMKEKFDVFELHAKKVSTKIDIQ